MTKNVSSPLLQEEQRRGMHHGGGHEKNNNEEQARTRKEDARLVLVRRGGSDATSFSCWCFHDLATHNFPRTRRTRAAEKNKKRVRDKKAGATPELDYSKNNFTIHSSL